MALGESRLKILLTCPPMAGMIDEFRPVFEDKGVEITIPKLEQTLSERELVNCLPEYDGWIIGDDLASRDVFLSGKSGNLKAAVKWGIGIDNIDFEAAKEFGIAITNTPGMFGAEVADLAMGYVIALARETFLIDRGVRNGHWPKPRGISLKGKTVGLIGYGDIGQQTAKRLLASDMMVIVYDPVYSDLTHSTKAQLSVWPQNLGKCDFLVFTCALNGQNRHMLNEKTLDACKQGVRIVNLARGPLFDEAALLIALENGRVHSTALDVMENEPLPMNSSLRGFERCIFGSHNASNTKEAVRATSLRVIDILFDFLDIE